MIQQMPLYLQIVFDLEASILDGTYKDKLPSSLEIAKINNVNMATACRALNTLIDKGLAVRRRGIGTFVAPDAAERLRSERINFFYQQLSSDMIELDISKQELIEYLQTMQ